MTDIQIRKRGLNIERVFHEGGPASDLPLLKGAVTTVVKNPFDGQFASGADLQAWMEDLRPLARDMAAELVAALGGQSRVETFGKGAIVGAMGEIEHGAIWHAPGGAAVRDALGGAKAQVPSSKKIGGIGAQVDIPLHYVHASMVRSHYDVMPVAVLDGPKPDEVVFALVMSTGSRIHARIGGLEKAGAKGLDGLV